MKTKFILHGGMTSEKNSSNDSFFKEFTKTLKDGDMVLFIPFARKEEVEQIEVFERDKVAILTQTDKSIVIEKAEPRLFAEQLSRAQAIFVTGGVTKILKDRLTACPDFPERIKGKVYAGSSAGANVVSTYHVSGFAEGVQEGLALVPIKLMAHYGNSDFNSTEENIKWFDEYSKELELVCLPECDWKIIEVDL